MKAFILRDIAAKEDLVEQHKGMHAEGYFAYQLKNIKNVEKYFINEGFYPNEEHPEGQTFQKIISPQTPKYQNVKIDTKSRHRIMFRYYLV